MTPKLASLTVAHVHAAPRPSLVGRHWSDKIPFVCHCL